MKHLVASEVETFKNKNEETSSTMKTEELTSLLGEYLTKSEAFDKLEAEMGEIKSKIKEAYKPLLESTHFPKGEEISIEVTDANGKKFTLAQEEVTRMTKSRSFKKDHPDMYKKYSSSFTQFVCSITGANKPAK